MAVLNDDIRLFIVRALARFDTPSQVARAVKAEFGVEIDRSQVQSYDPGKALAAHGLGKRWKELFARERRKFVEDTSEIPISHRAVRLRTLDRLARKAEETGNSPLAASLMEQAAKEIGNLYTDRRSLALTGAEGGSIRIEQRHSHDLAELADRTPDELVRMFADAVVGPKLLGS